MPTSRCRRSTPSLRTRAFALILAVLPLGAPWAASPSPDRAPVRGVGEFTVPAWFKNAFLDLREDAAEAAAAGRRLLLYVGQDGCPYCAALINVNFSQKPIVDYARAHFDAIEINLWGDRPVTDFDGEVLTEKTFAAKHRVAFTPTIMFFDGSGAPLLRINGYYPPRQFAAALRYVAEDRAGREPFAAYLERVAPRRETGTLQAEPFFEQGPHDLREPASGRPVVVFLEQRDCEPCEAMHRDVLSRPETREMLTRFRAIQLDRWSATPLTTPDGRATTARAWADALNVAYVPAVLFFDQGREVMRLEAQFQAFHVQSAIDYVASGAYREQPSFQRFVQGRSERLRGRGVAVDLWE